MLSSIIVVVAFYFDVGRFKVCLCFTVDCSVVVNSEVDIINYFRVHSRMCRWRVCKGWQVDTHSFGVGGSWIDDVGTLSMVHIHACCISCLP